MSIIGLLLLVSATFGLSKAYAQNAEEILDFETPEEFTDFSPSHQDEAIEEEVYEPTEEDLTDLTQEEAVELDEDDYIEYQMQTGNYTVEDDGTVVIPDERDQGVGPQCVACANGKWKLKVTAGPTTVYGAWKSIASGWGPGSLSKTVTETRTNSYTGTLSASKSAVNTAVGFNISKSSTKSVTYSGTIKSGKQGFLQTRPAYKKYTVRQQYVKFGKVQQTRYVYPRKFWLTDHRIGY